MEKLSSILPSNSRIRSVDLKASQASRPGTPNFGQRIGTTAGTQDKIDLSRAVQAGSRAMEETLAVRNPKEAEHRRIADDATRNFFDTRLRTEPRDSEVDDVPGPALPSTGIETPIVTEQLVAPTASEQAPEQTRSLDLYA